MKNRKVKVGFILFSLIAGGAERNAINIARSLDKEISIDIIIFKKIIDYQKEYPGLDTQLSIISLFGKNKVPKILLPIFAIYLFVRLFYLVKRNQYDVLIAGAEYYNVYFTVLIALLTYTKSVLVVGNNLTEELKHSDFLFRSFHTFMHRLAFRFSTHVICVSRGLTRDIKRNFFIPDEKITTIYNGVNHEEILFKLRRAKTNRLEKEIILMSLGRLVAKKGHIHLIKAFTKVKQAYPKAKLYIIGKGPLSETLQRAINVLNLQKNIKLVGFIEKNPYLFLSKGNIFVFPSLYEGFGNVIIEAMACGLPVISTNCNYGPAEILSADPKRLANLNKVTVERYGILVPNFANNSTAINSLSREELLLAEAIIKSISDKKLRNNLRKAGFDRSRDFSAENMGARYYRVINELVLRQKAIIYG